jgi:hypothetical protein
MAGQFASRAPPTPRATAWRWSPGTQPLPDLDVLANLFTKRERLLGVFFDRAAMAALAAPVLAELGLPYDCAPVAN